MNKGKYQFKEVDLAINFKKVPVCDQEYLRTMFYETVLDRSVKHTGISFREFYPDANSFTIFDDLTDLHEHMNEYVNPYAYTGSHLLHGKKYYLAWNHENNDHLTTILINRGYSVTI
jgi:hypothetical protein